MVCGEPRCAKCDGKRHASWHLGCKVPSGNSLSHRTEIHMCFHQLISQKVVQIYRNLREAYYHKHMSLEKRFTHVSYAQRGALSGYSSCLLSMTTHDTWYDRSITMHSRRAVLQHKATGGGVPRLYPGEHGMFTLSQHQVRMAGVGATIGSRCLSAAVYTNWPTRRLIRDPPASREVAESITSETFGGEGLHPGRISSHSPW